MRVVGGKTGADGRLFAYIVWTVPGGPAEKGGLQQGDKVSILIPCTNNRGVQVL
jgi:S1-C subfamily serine protease